MNDRIYMSPPDVGALEEEAALRAIRSGWVAPLGPEVDAFEAEIAQRSGRGHGVALSSGTAALHLGLLCLEVCPGDVVFTSTLTFVATANAILQARAVPWFVDVEVTTGNMDPSLLRAAILQARKQGLKVGAIVPVDLLGKCANYSDLLQVADKFGIPVLCDSAEAFGAFHKGTPAGSHGKAAVFSFNGNKILTTSGGGMLVTDDPELAHRARYLASQARQPAVHYEHTESGFNYRLSNVLAAIGRAQLSRIDDMISARKSIRAAYRAELENLAGVSIFGGMDDAEDNYWLTAIWVEPRITGWSPLDLHAALAEANIESRPLWKPMHLQPMFSQSQSVLNGNSETIFNQCLTLPSGSGMSDDQLNRVLGVFRTLSSGACS
jgi:dTDP-4-amino-4,6-dideoxygalactose transaminase